MAVFHPHTVKCICGQTLTVLLADSINVKRSPEAREDPALGVASHDVPGVQASNDGREALLLHGPDQKRILQSVPARRAAFVEAGFRRSRYRFFAGA